MISGAFLLGLVLLLATPGPTNTLLALAGATQAPDKAVRLLLPRLLFAELAGYLSAVLLLGALMHVVGDGIALIRPALQAAAALYLALAALRMWRARGDMAAGAAVAPRQILATTLLNPKTLIIALVLMPAGWSGQGAVAATHLAAMALALATACTTLFTSRSKESAVPPSSRASSAIAFRSSTRRSMRRPTWMT